MQKKLKNNILVLSGLDPQGSAGISADILSINNASGFVMPLVTNITIQNTKKFYGYKAVASQILQQQFDAIIEDSSIDIIKIGLISAENLVALTYILQNSSAKVVLDPIIKSSTGDSLDNIKVILSLLPYVYLLTPNAYELERLTNEKNQDKAVKKLGLPYTLITQTDNSEKIITHKLYQQNKLIKEFNYQKLDGNYHGSGCILASSISAKLTTLSVINACKYGLDYTYQTLKNAKEIGKIQLSPSHYKL